MATLGLKEMGKFLWKGREYGGERNGHWIDILRYSYRISHSRDATGFSNPGGLAVMWWA